MELPLDSSPRMIDGEIELRRWLPLKRRRFAFFSLARLSRFSTDCHRDTELTTEETNHSITGAPVYAKDFRLGEDPGFVVVNSCGKSSPHVPRTNSG
ncbi:hypothetical protein AVEN_269058-1 [Araneus ventricosus]|uniref:Uncharacterized protein n=1 Tax=Araneus ventricosus TaxID=182803 RepID=A0A4Y2JG17_ARAVE|nr:hypothetical protein AVEN_269058-1 [Araneus ventricosus]